MKLAEIQTSPGYSKEWGLIAENQNRLLTAAQKCRAGEGYRQQRHLFDIEETIIQGWDEARRGVKPLELGGMKYEILSCNQIEPAFLLYPNAKRPADLSVLRQFLEGDAERGGYRHYLNQINRKLSQTPLIMVYIPDGFGEQDENELMKEFGWVQDHGSFIFMTNHGLLQLAARANSHEAHEARHLATELGDPHLYYTLLFPYPYIDEAIAIAHQIQATQPRHDKRTLIGAISGLEHRYLSELSASDITHPLDFARLNGDGEFASHLYAHRMILGIFLLALLSSQQDNKQHYRLTNEQSPLSDAIFLSAMNGLDNFSAPVDKLDDFMNQLSRNTGNQDITDEYFWHQLSKYLILDDELSSISNSRKYFEECYQKYGGYIFLRYIFSQRSLTFIGDNAIQNLAPELIEYFNTIGNNIQPIIIEERHLTFKRFFIDPMHGF